MCGIAGFVGRGGRTDLSAMTEALVHRGPDGEGIFIDDKAGVFLGHRRLAILDIAGGAQPMWNEEGNVCVIFNGEIYNHVELRRELERKGHRFRSDHSDTEVLVHGYEEWGEALPERLNAMFAFAIYDAPRRRLFLARDRFGEKPLYYAQLPGLFAFASELSALCQHRGIPCDIELQSVQKLFAYGYIPAPRALVRNTRKLPAGHHLLIDIASGEIRTKAYWRFRLNSDSTLSDRDEPRLVDELTHLLSEAVRRRTISDVPLGIFLSGGIDSGSVLSQLARHVPASTIKSFTIGFTEPSFDEAPQARELAAAFRTDHKEQQLDLDRARDLIPQVLGRLDEPLGDASILPTYLLSSFTRRFVTVALSGDGGDELFAGYDPFKALTPARLYARLVPSGLHKGFKRLADCLPISMHNMSFEFKLKRALAGMSYPAALWNPIWMAPASSIDIEALLETKVHPEELYEEAIALWNSSTNSDDVDRTLEFFTNFYLQDNILAKVDRAAMMVSLETRAVFLDNDLVDFCRKLPHRFKFRRGERKYLLKKAMARFVPQTTLARRKKGFGIPLARWLKSLDLTAESGSRRTSSAIARRWWQEQRNGQVDRRLALWTWLSLQHCSSGRMHEIRGG
ncbi:MAG: asparagine synthase (glutamine-hydrolyzing) [Acidobacteriaceae bacterium]|nr:asparagine synthase (glutamine-hydrolyzing) [Acidobacteriaceae bacterium]MBV9940194.1 asparagine synthase (glutamine-hydrolyzing) [Acidobacteriaceae bacterium]